jgi:hypothetical protein
MTGKDIGVDFDGTCVKHEFPNVGETLEGCVDTLLELVENGHRLILFTLRCDNSKGNYLTQAVEWFKKHNIPLYGIQTNPKQKHWTTSPKAYAQLYIDDCGLGMPLVKPDNNERPYVDWFEVRELLFEKGYLTQASYDKLNMINHIQLLLNDTLLDINTPNSLAPARMERMLVEKFGYKEVDHSKAEINGFAHDFFYTFEHETLDNLLYKGSLFYGNYKLTKDN